MDRKFLEGFELPAEAIEKIIAEHGRSTQSLIVERDGLKKQLDDANTAITGFKDIDPERMSKEIADWKKKAEDAEATATKTAHLRKVERYVDGLGIKSTLAKTALVSKLVEKNLQTEGDTLLGADDYVKTLKEQDPIAFATDAPPAKGGAGFGDKNPPGTAKNANDFMNSLIRGESSEGV